MATLYTIIHTIVIGDIEGVETLGGGVGDKAAVIYESICKGTNNKVR